MSETRTSLWSGSWAGAALIAACAAAGGLAALGLAPYHLPSATLLGLAIVIAICATAPNARGAALALWMFGIGYFGFGLRWIVEPFQIERDLHGWMAPFALVGMAAGLSLFWAAAGWAGWRLARTRSGRAAALVLAVGLAEFARAYVLTGFPWAGFAQIWIEALPRLWLQWVGPHGLGLMTLLIAAMPMIWPRRALLATLGALGVLWGGGAALQTAVPTDVPLTDITVRVVQPNAPQDEKWDPEKWRTFFWRQIDATRAGSVPDLIVWPEVAIPQLLERADEVLAVMADAARGAPVVFGTQRMDGEKFFNALAVLDTGPQIAATYDKHHLVPFGEYMPLPGLFRRLGIRGLAERVDMGHSRGPGPKLIEVAGLRALPMICYEAVFPQFSRAPEGRSDVLLQITNDAWFGKAAGPQQHFVQARMRAIEQGVPLVRSANTGISAVIDPWGRVTAALPLGESGHLDAAIPAPAAPTFYSRVGDGAFGAFLVIWLSCFLLVYRRGVSD